MLESQVSLVQAQILFKSQASSSRLPAAFLLCVNEVRAGRHGACCHTDPGQDSLQAVCLQLILVAEMKRDRVHGRPVLTSRGGLQGNLRQDCLTTPWII